MLVQESDYKRLYSQCVLNSPICLNPHYVRYYKYIS